MMKLRFSLFLLSVCGALVFAACSAVPSGGRVIGGEPISITELPTYPGATELSANQSKIVDPIFGPAQQETPPFIGLGVQVVKTRRNFKVPPETTFDDIKASY